MPSTISLIDQKIDAIRAELCKLERVNRSSAASWQRAWDLHPRLHQRETELFAQRGRAQQERDEKAEKVHKISMRSARRSDNAAQKRTIRLALFAEQIGAAS